MELLFCDNKYKDVLRVISSNLLYGSLLNISLVNKNAYLQLKESLQKKYKEINPKCTIDILSYACKNCDIIYVKYYLKRYLITTENKFILFILTCKSLNNSDITKKYEYMDIIKLLLTDDVAEFINSDDMEGIIDIEDLLDIVSSFYDMFELYLDKCLCESSSYNMKNNTFVACCEKGYIYEAVEIHFKYQIDSFQKKCGFIDACGNGHVNIVGWFLTNNEFMPSNINITWISEAFKQACFNNHLKVAQLLYDNYKLLLSENISYGDLFFNMCKYGNIEILKWLYTLNREIFYINNHGAFRAACHFNRYDIVEWLCSVEPIYSYKVIDNKIEHNIPC